MYKIKSFTMHQNCNMVKFQKFLKFYFKFYGELQELQTSKSIEEHLEE